jgi:hypothetical protein
MQPGPGAAAGSPSCERKVSRTEGKRRVSNIAQLSDIGTNWASHAAPPFSATLDIPRSRVTAGGDAVWRRVDQRVDWTSLWAAQCQSSQHNPTFWCHVVARSEKGRRFPQKLLRGHVEYNVQPTLHPCFGRRVPSAYSRLCTRKAMMGAFSAQVNIIIHIIA